MDNWVIFLLINVVLVIVLNVFSNFATPWIKSAYERSVFSSRKKRIVSHIVEYKRLKNLRDNLARLVIVMLIRLAEGLVNIAVLIGLVGIYIVYNTAKPESSKALPLEIISISISTLLTVLSFWQAFHVASNVFSIDEYKEKTIKKLKKLGLSTEEAIELLDKEEIENK